MYDNLLEKVENEYEKFYMYIRLISRVEIYTRAYEIAVKKALYERLIQDLKENRIPEETETRLMAEENPVDYLYLKGGSHAVLAGDSSGAHITEKSWKMILTSLKF